MYVVRVYKDYDTNKNVGAKIVDEKTMQFREVDWETLEKVVRKNSNSIDNMEIDSYGKVKLKNLNPNRKIKYYNQHYIDNLIINQYCIITDNRIGRLDFVADSNNGIHYGKNVSIGDIATTLGVPEISKLKLFNAYVELGTSDYEVYVFKGNNYRKLPKLKLTSVVDLLGDEWDYKLLGTGQDGIRLARLERVDKVGEATLPDGISYIGEFLGGVNSLILPISVKELGIGCFEKLDDLIRVEIGKGINHIPKNCFRDSSVKEVKFSGYEELIGEYAFYASNIRGPVVTSAIEIKREAFSQTGITSLITTRAKEIDICAFEFCSDLSKVKFDCALEIIKGGAFRSCSRLKEVYIPQSVKHIGKHAFKGCNKLRLAQVPIECNIADNAFPKKCQIIRY